VFILFGEADAEGEEGKEGSESIKELALDTELFLGIEFVLDRLRKFDRGEPLFT
jgi:hypothetical protein